MTTHNLTVKGVHCKSCKILIEDALKDLGATNIVVSIDEKKQTGKIQCDYGGEKNRIVHAIAAEGYTVQ